MQVIELVEEMQSICENLRQDGHLIRFVPTMGALHIGHGSLIQSASKQKENHFHQDVTVGHQYHGRAIPESTTTAAVKNVGGEDHHHHRLDHDDVDEEMRMLNLRGNNSILKKGQRAVVVIVSIFVNPKQFNSSDDFLNYPKNLQADLELCKKHNVRYVFLPNTSELYPTLVDNTPQNNAHCMVVPPDKVANDLEGKSRAGHFEGMLTIVCKLFNIIRPHEAYFGEKDYQQLILVSKMAQDLNMGVNIRPVETVRDVDLLPLSSRNVRMTEKQRQVAPIMYDILIDAKRALESKRTTYDHNGNKSLDTTATILASMLTTICMNLDSETSKLIEVDYLELRCAKDISKICHKQDINAFDCQEGCVKRQLQAGGDSALRARLLTSVIVGKVRLLDNIEIRLNLNDTDQQVV